MYLHYSVGGKSIIGRQTNGLIAPSLRDRVIFNPTLIQQIDGDGLFDDSEEAIFPFVVAFATVEDDLCFGTNLSSMDGDLRHFLGRPFATKYPNPGASFFQRRLLVPVQALQDLYGPVSSWVRNRDRCEFFGGLRLVHAGHRKGIGLLEI